MKKLILSLDTLSVESFETAPELEARGTVQGHATWQYNGCTANQPCNPASSPDYSLDYTCDDYSCWETCGNSCNGTCYDSCNCASQVNTCWETCQATVPC